MLLKTRVSTLVSEGSPTSAIGVACNEMFENLTNKLENIFSKLKQAPSLTEEQVNSGLKEIRQALNNASKGRSVLIIAHRLSTIAHADRIIVLEKGSIIEMGNHENLLLKKGRYYSLWTKQLSEEEPAA